MNLISFFVIVFSIVYKIKLNNNIKIMEKETKEKETKQTKKLIIIIIVLVILGIITALIFFFVSDNKSIQKEEEISQENSDNIVARVNSQEITITDLENAENQIINSQGIDPATVDENISSQIKNQALDNLIADILINEAIVQSGFTVSAEDVDTELNAIKSRFTENGQYEEALATEGISESDLRLQIETNISSQAYFKEVLDLESISVTEEEINNFYEKEATNSENIPPLEEIYGQIESFVKQEKQQKLFLEHVQKLKDQAEIEIML